MFPQIRATRGIGTALSLALAGCAGLKNVDLGPKTIPSIGDRQISVTSGRPGEETIIRTETATPKFDVREARRISGRVIDHRGQPVSGATVRLADSALASGQISDVITDEAGGFTVRGLRGSTPYTLIATLDLGGETRVSRARFVSGETQARIVLEPSDSPSSEAPTVASARPRAEERAVVETEKKSVANRPPMPPRGRWIFVDESDEVVANVPVRSEDKGVKRVSRSQAVDESDVESEEEVDAPRKPKRPVNSDWRSGEKPPVRVVRDPAFRPASYVSDDENPLPPARERKAYVYEEFEEEQPPRRRIASAEPVDRSREPRPLPDDLVPVTETPSAEELAENYARRDARSYRPEPEPRPMPSRRSPAIYSDAPSAGSLRVEDIEEVNRMIRERRARERALAGGSDPRVRDEYEESATWENVARPMRIEPAPRTDRTINRTVRSSESLAPPSDLPEVANPRRYPMDSAASPTRGLERSFAQRESIDRSLKSASRAASGLGRSDDVVARSDQERIDRLKAADDKKGNAFNGDSPRSSNEWINRLTASLPWSRKTSDSSTSIVSGAFCDFDEENQRIVDFELTDIKGRATRFSQIPADLTLIVFWGTWCKPCHEAMPHLVELQKRLESDGVQVLGIAYEEGSFQQRQEKVAAAVERYDINFPILLGTAQGADACPVRKSLGVRVYPTLVLVDRAGRVLWRDQGVTQATFGRLDKVMAAHLQELDSKVIADGSAPVRR